jgi:hypothetical protein
MSVKSSHSIAVVMFLVTGVLSVRPAEAQDAVSPLADQLKADYKLAKRGSDSNGEGIVDTGTVLVIQKGGILGVPLSNAAMGTATYKDGNLHGPGSFVAGMLGKNTRQLTVGEKVYVTKMDIHQKNDKITMVIVECDSCNGAQQVSSYKSEVIFQFPKDYLSKADASQVKDVISQVLAPDTSDQQQQAQAQQPATNQSQAPPATIEPGQTIEQVQAALGQPEKIVNLGQKQIYVYKDLKITFVSGKVTDVQ